MAPLATTVEVVLATARGGQHGVVTRTQLLGAGVTEHEIRHRVGPGALLREHRGVYRVGHRAPSVEARYLAAVLACGDDARLSGRAAAHLFGLVKGRAPPPEVTRAAQAARRGRRGCGGRRSTAGPRDLPRRSRSPPSRAR